MTRMAFAVMVLAAVASMARSQSAEEKAVAVELRWMSVSEATFQRIGEKLGVTERVGKAKELSELEVFLLMEALQADPRSNVLLAPKLIVPDGSEGKVSIGEDKPWSCMVRPVVSADGKCVRLSLRGELGYLADEEVKVRKTLTVPDGVTVVMGGWKTKVSRACPDQPSTLSTIPYVCRLFVNAQSGPEEGRLLLFATPHILSSPSTPAPPKRAVGE